LESFVQPAMNMPCRIGTAVLKRVLENLVEVACG